MIMKRCIIVVVLMKKRNFKQEKRMDGAINDRGREFNGFVTVSGEEMRYVISNRNRQILIIITNRVYEKKDPKLLFSFD